MTLMKNPSVPCRAGVSSKLAPILPADASGSLAKLDRHASAQGNSEKPGWFDKNHST
jgi:hypothetical protein